MNPFPFFTPNSRSVQRNVEVEWFSRWRVGGDRFVRIAIPTRGSYWEGLKARVTSKVQVTIPKEFGARYGIEPGAEVDFAAAEDGIRLRKVVDCGKQKAAFGCLKSELGDRSVPELIDELRGPIEVPEGLHENQ